MRRLIDANALLEDVRQNSQSYWADDFAHIWVDKQPTVEAEPVIRCMDCKWFGAWYCDLLHFGIVDINKYCAWAERKEE